MARQLIVEILGDASKFNTATKGAATEASRFGNVLQGVGQGIGITAFGGIAGVASTVGTAFVDFVGDSMVAASDLREALSLTGQVFDDGADDIEAWAETAATEMGASKTEATNMAALFGTQFKAIGLDMDDVGDKSKEMSELAGDLGSAFNTGSEEAAAALRSGLLGEAEPMRKFGVTLTAAKVNAKALELGMKPLNGQFTEGEKTLARYEIIMEETADSQGMFGRDTDSLADSQKILNAEMDNLSATLGTILLPYMTDLVQFISTEVVPKLQEFSTWLKDNEVVIDLVGDALDYLINGPVKSAINQTQEMAEEQGKAAGEAARSWDTNSEKIGGSLQNISDDSDDMKDDVVDDNKTVTKTYKELASFLLGQFNTDYDAAMDIVDARADLSALKSDEAAQKKIINSGKSTAAEKADAEKRLGEIAGEQSAAYATIEKYNGMSEADYENWSTVVKGQYDKAKGAEKSFFGQAWGHIQDLKTASKNDIVQRVEIRTEYTYSGQAAKPGQAPKPRARGGPARGLTLVGEEGPEILDLPAGSYVHNNTDSMRMASKSLGSSGRSAPGTVNITINGAQDVRAIMLELRRELTRQGMSFA